METFTLAKPQPTIGKGLCELKGDFAVELPDSNGTFKGPTTFSNYERLTVNEINDA